MAQEIFQAAADEPGVRLDAWLAEKSPALSRAYIQKLIAQQLVTVGGKPVKANYKVKSGDTIAVEVPEAQPLAVEARPMDLDIVYEDQDVLVLNKPAGLVVHPAHGHDNDTLVSGLLAHCEDLSGINGVMRPGIVHRIDKDTSGLLLVAKNDMAHQSLAQQLKDHSVERAYLALVHGVLNEPAGLVDAPVGRHPNDRKKMAVVLSAGAKTAVTHYTVKERFRRHTLVECRLETGRTHQIRVHMAYLGHPLAGDPLYGSRKNNLELSGQALHAYLLGFDHPRTGERLTFEVPLPEHFQRVLTLLRQED